MKPGTDYDAHEAFLLGWSDSGRAGNVKDRKSQSSFNNDVDRMSALFCITQAEGPRDSVDSKSLPQRARLSHGKSNSHVEDKIFNSK